MEKWSELDIKSKFLYISCALAFILGWGLTIAGFIVPPLGEISNTVLVVLGQALTYCAAGFGIGQYIKYQIAKLNKNN